ncbi:CMD domain-containing protein [Enterobacter cloacae]|uniref:CMD domain-containing protein n=1 Tax=Enterobacter cloacae TaxID=550 RepID=UPI00062C9C32|nr:oxidoreductase [Enterobacter cloacae]HCR2005522.1 CMD domain-containing protein [Enterobacter cloacae subsp. dissolvens]ELE9011159.1 CMD domain-containing protein [Enterobacter cloacae]KKY84697.1 oxidoreductase [Enterobacter cloacae]MCR1554358.1 CMD domain-containing protein [Enterobacter cloacae]RHI06069.1 CMD domain-containing protein [Enterobacter cloacae]
MEQRRFSGKGHWYHETQSNHAQTDVLPLVPEAANVDDRFLLDLALPDEIVAACSGWLTPARALCHLLFPLDIPVNRLHTLSAYDRLSTALTVAQACGVQRLCNHYAALLAPLPGPDSSRESNRRLAQITQYARQLASSPDVIDDKAQNQLDEVGLTTYDIVLISQIIGFIGFQARVVAVFQALLGHPVRWLPGHHIQPHTLPVRPGAWIALLPVVELRYASAHQLESLSRWQAEPALQALTPVLCHEPMLLDLTGEILNHCREEAWVTSSALSAAVELLTRSPDRFSAAQFNPLTEEGLPADRAIALLTRSAFDGWLERLKVALGKAE